MEILERPLSQKEINDCAKLVLINDNKMHYVSYAKGQYELYCPFCQTYKRVDYKQLCQIRKNQECPTCFRRRMRFTRETTLTVEDYVRIENYGYRFKVKWNFGELPHVLETEQCMYFAQNSTYVKDLYLKNFGKSIGKQDEDYITHKYRESKSAYWGYDTYIYPNPTLPVFIANPKLIKRIALENDLDDRCKTMLKSNQKKMVIDNDVTIKQIEYIVAFDLNDIEYVYKYSDYLKENESHIREYVYDNIKLNHFYLDYLVDKKIDLGKYYHFLHNLKDLGFKYEKPSDFTHRSAVVQELYNQHQEEIKEKKISKRYETLPKYETKDIVISPFKSAQQIIDCGKALHNCIGGYVSRYANSETDLYHLDVAEKLTIAIEIKNNELWQAYSDGNRKCPNNLMEHIKQFCKVNNFKLGTYA